MGAGRPFTVGEIDLAEPGPDVVVVQMVAAGSCGTDPHSVRAELTSPTPMTPATRVRASSYGPLEHVRAGRSELDAPVGPVFSLDDVNDAIEASLARVPGRVLVTP